MNIPCPNRLDCPGTDSPVSNLTSEKPDQEIFIGFNTGWGWNFPLLGSEWQRSNCLGVCTSTVSQAEADLCAAMANLECLVDSWGPPGTGPGPTSGPPVITPSTGVTLYESQSQVCLLNCADGSPFVYGIPAGYVKALSQQQANSIAYSQACYLGSRAILCLSAISNHACKGETYTSFILSSRGPVHYSIVSGTLPPGMTGSQSSSTAFRITGVPTTPGNYQFTIRAEASGGIFMQKTYTIHVLGLAPAVLPDANKGEFYTATLTPTGFGGTVTFSVYSGTFPAGVTLSSSGTISGTPTEGGEFTVYVRATDSAAGSCVVQYALHVEEGCNGWIEIAPAGYVAQQYVAPGGTGLARQGLTRYILKNRVWSGPVALPGFETPFAITPNGDIWGESYPVTFRRWSIPFGGAVIQMGHTPGIDNSQMGFNENTDGWAVSQYSTASSWRLEVMAPDGSIVTTLGDGVTNLTWNPSGAPGQNGHVIFVYAGTYRMWYPGVGIVSLGLPNDSGNFEDCASTGHAVIHNGFDAPYRGYFWNGVSSTLIYSPAAGLAISRINASDTIVGMVTGGSSFYRWTQSGGVVSLGLPPGAASGSNIWITDSGLIIAQANNGAWHYRDGAWAGISEILPSTDTGWSAFVVLYDVTKDGHGVGYGTYNAVPVTEFWCKFCNPTPP